METVVSLSSLRNHRKAAIAAETAEALVSVLGDHLCSATWPDGATAEIVDLALRRARAALVSGLAAGRAPSGDAQPMVTGTFAVAVGAEPARAVETAKPSEPRPVAPGGGGAALRSAEIIALTERRFLRRR